LLWIYRLWTIPVNKAFVQHYNMYKVLISDMQARTH